MHIDWHPNTRKLREFGIFGGFFLLFLLTLIAWNQPKVLYSPGLSLGTCMIGGAGLLLVLGCLTPILLRPFFIILSIITFPIGFVINLVVLALLFYVIFTPIAIAFRIVGRDSMERRFKTTSASYWEKRTRNRTPESYYQPF